MTNFLTKSEFTKLVERSVLNKRMSYLEAVLHICEENGIDPEDSKKFISAPIQEKLEAEAMQLNLIPKGGILNFG